MSQQMAHAHASNNPGGHHGRSGNSTVLSQERHQQRNSQILSRPGAAAANYNSVGSHQPHGNKHRSTEMQVSRPKNQG